MPLRCYWFRRSMWFPPFLSISDVAPKYPRPGAQRFQAVEKFQVQNAFHTQKVLHELAMNPAGRYGQVRPLPRLWCGMPLIAECEVWRLRLGQLGQDLSTFPWLFPNFSQTLPWRYSALLCYMCLSRSYTRFLIFISIVYLENKIRVWSQFEASWSFNFKLHPLLNNAPCFQEIPDLYTSMFLFRLLRLGKGFGRNLKMIRGAAANEDMI